MTRAEIWVRSWPGSGWLESSYIAIAHLIKKGMYVSEITYRNAAVADIPGICRLWRGFWPEQPYEQNLRQKIELDPDLVYVAELDKEIIGTVVGGFDGWWGWIYRFAVMPGSQNRGIATRLIKEIQTRLKALGAKSANLII